PVPHEPRFDRGPGGDRGPDSDQGGQQEGEGPQGDEGEGAWARHRARGRGHGLASARGLARGRAAAARPRPARTATRATSPSRAVAPNVSTTPRAMVGTASTAWAGTKPRWRLRESAASAAAETPYWARTAMLESLNSSLGSTAFTNPVTITQVTSRARMGTSRALKRSMPNKSRAPLARAERSRGVVTIIPKQIPRGGGLVPR